MIHHYSIPVSFPEETATKLTKLFDGVLTLFGPHINSYIVWFGDEYGSAIELYPRGTKMLPDKHFGQANFIIQEQSSQYCATHAAISINKSEKEIFEFASKYNWQAQRLPRGGFDVIEFWIENSVMIELLTPEMASDYIKLTSKFRPNEKI